MGKDESKGTKEARKGGRQRREEGGKEGKEKK